MVVDAAAHAGGVLVLGATGIIGADTTAACLRIGHTVTALSRRPTRDPRLSGVTEHLLADTTDASRLGVVLGDRRFASVLDFTSFDAADVERTLSVLAGRCEQYVLVSSATVYAGAREGVPIDEDTPVLTSGWAYPLAKVAAEDAARATCARLGIACTVVRPYITYSDQRIPLSVWEAPEVMERLRDGRPVPVGPDLLDATTTVTSAVDVAEALARLAANPRAFDDGFIVASDRSTTWREVLTLVANRVGGTLVTLDCTTTELASAFPAVRGKIADRAAGRTFDVARLMAVVPNLDFRHSTAGGLARAVDTYVERGVPACPRTLDGRMDRFTAAHSTGDTLRALARDLTGGRRRHRLGGLARYLVGREAHLWAAVGARAARQSSPYA